MSFTGNCVAKSGRFLFCRNNQRGGAVAFLPLSVQTKPVLLLSGQRHRTFVEQARQLTSINSSSCVCDLVPSCSPQSEAAMRPVVVSGPSGGGKSTLVNKLMQQPHFKNKFMFSVSHTTRSPRLGEEEGVAYHFTSRETFQQMIARGDFLEWAEFGGNLYGTSKQAVAAVAANQHRPVCLLDLEVNGVRQLKQLDKDGKGLNCFYIFITVPSMQVLEARLRGRGTETEASVQKRLVRAQQDSEYGLESAGNFDLVIINDSLENAYSQFERTMLEVNPHLLATPPAPAALSDGGGGRGDCSAEERTQTTENNPKQ